MARETALEVLIAAMSVGALSYVLSHDLRWLPSFGPRAPQKQFETLDEFFPHYLKEHSDETCRGLHVLSTGLAFFYAFIWNMGHIHKTVTWLGLSAALGCVVHQLTISEPNGLAEAAAVFTSVLLLSIVLGVPAQQPLVTLVIGYAFAWYGHYAFEKNVPATFTYPTWSLISDVKMMLMIVKGDLSARLPYLS